MCQSTYRYGKANNKYMKNYDKQIETSYLTYLDANNLHGWARSLKTPVKQKHFIKKKITIRTMMKDLFLTWIMSTQNNYGVLIKTYHFSLKQNN